MVVFQEFRGFGILGNGDSDIRDSGGQDSEQHMLIRHKFFYTCIFLHIRPYLTLFHFAPKKTKIFVERAKPNRRRFSL